MKITYFLILILMSFLSCKNQRVHDHHENHDDHEHAHAQDSLHEEEHHHEELSNVGPAFAVIAADPHEGLQLSEAALKRTAIQIRPVEEDGSVTLPHVSIVHELNLTGVYRWRGGWFKFIPVQEGNASDHEAQQRITSPDLKAGDQVVISGAGLLRIAELDVFTTDVEGHSH